MKEGFLEKLLAYYGLTQEDYAALAREPSFSSIPGIESFPATKIAVGRIRMAIENNEKTLIYGDYDADGIMACSILARCFHLLGKSVSTYIPSRYVDGYGLTMENAKKIASSGYGLLILVDNGVSCLQEVSYLRSQGVETIIIDHHDLPDLLPPSIACIHPSTLPYGQYPVSAGYLSFLFSVPLLGKVDEYLLTLGAISTISDCMPMKGHNRTLVALALRAIRKHQYPEIASLAESSFIDESTLSMVVVPCINAVGRMVEDSKINRLVPYFAELSVDKKEAVASWMKEINAGRKQATKETYEKLRLDPSASAIVIVGRLKEGLNGLLASRLLSEFHKPIVVFSPAKNDSSLYVGSIRSDEGCNVMDFERHVGKLIVKGGGHAFAGGVSIKKEDYGEFKKEFEDYAFRHPIEKPKSNPIPITLSDITKESYRILRIFGPFGHDYPEPEFELSNLGVSSLRWTNDGKYLSTPLGLDCRLLSFSYPKPKNISPEDKVSLIGTMRLNDFQGKVSLNFRARVK